MERVEKLENSTEESLGIEETVCMKSVVRNWRDPTHHQKEYRTLFLFVKNPRIILTKRQILEKLWDIDGDFVDEHTLTTIISRIRKKIETDERKYIKTAYGMGYQWIGGEPR